MINIRSITGKHIHNEPRMHNPSLSMKIGAHPNACLVTINSFSWIPLKKKKTRITNNCSSWVSSLSEIPEVHLTLSRLSFCIQCFHASISFLNKRPPWTWKNPTCWASTGNIFMKNTLPCYSFFNFGKIEILLVKGCCTKIWLWPWCGFFGGDGPIAIMTEGQSHLQEIF